jgi:hypothetical protein
MAEAANPMTANLRMEKRDTTNTPYLTVGYQIQLVTKVVGQARLLKTN